MKKFMMTINAQVFHLLEEEAKDREVSVQEFVRAVILPYWLKKQVTAQRPAQPVAEPNRLMK